MVPWALNPNGRGRREHIAITAYVMRPAILSRRGRIHLLRQSRSLPASRAYSLLRTRSSASRDGWLVAEIDYRVAAALAAEQGMFMGTISDLAETLDDALGRARKSSRSSRTASRSFGVMTRARQGRQPGRLAVIALVAAPKLITGASDPRPSSMT